MSDPATHPWTLLAVAAGWSLRRAAVELFRVGPPDGDHGTLRSTAASTGRSGGGHADPIGTAVLRGTSGAYARLLDQVAEDITAARWLCRSDPDRRPSTARDAYAHLAAADKRIRAALHMPPDHLPMIGNPPCPGCGTRLLRIWTSAPDPRDHVVICTADCRCTNSCGCGMDVRESGAPHVWSGDSTLVTALLPAAA